MSLQKKFLIPIIILVLALGLYLRLSWAPNLLAFVEDEETQAIQSHLKSVTQGLVPLLLENQLANVYENLDSVLGSNKSWKSIVLYDQYNKQLYPLTEINIAHDDPSEFILVQAIKIFDDELGQILLVVDLKPSREKLQTLQTRLNIVLIVSIILFIIGIFILVRHLLHIPLNKLIDASQKMIKGDFDIQLSANQRDEIGKLIKSFMAMRESIEKYQNDLRTEVDKHKSTSHELFKEKEHATYHASHDALTDLYNRREFESQLAKAVDDAHIHGSTHALVYMDLDQFKVVNDTCGHIAGDTLLKQLTALLTHRKREADILARLGGDEFGLIFKNCPVESAKSIATDISKLIQEFRFEWKGNIFRVGVSMGLVPITPSSDDLTALLSAADTACYAAKDAGRNKIHIFTQDDNEVTQRQGEMQWISEISKALEEDRFSLWYQAVSNTENPQTDFEYYELLLRMHNKNGQLILPGTFLPAAERYNQIENIDKYVVKYLFQYLANKETTNIFGINISGASISNPAFLDYVINLFKQYDVEGGNIVFEITESVIISDLSRASEFIATLRNHGCRFALDDFGMGLSSLEYLKILKVDYIKIDGYFVRDITTDPIDKEMVRCIHEICRIMGVRSIAEFVETEEIYHALCDLGVDLIQGYWISEPQPLIAPTEMKTNTQPNLNKGQC